MAKIKEVRAREILNGKGEPTIETTVILSDGKFGISSCPTGTSTGTYEAVELRDHDNSRFLGRGVLKAISNIRSIISPAILGMDANKQQEIDKRLIELDGTSNKGRLGANAVLSVSTATCKAAAQSSLLPLYMYLREYIRKENLVLKIPTPIFNIVNGNREENGADFKEFLVMGASSKTYSESLEMISSINNSVKTNLKSNNLSTLVSDEGGFSPEVSTNADALNLIKKSIESVNLRLGFDIFLGIDPDSNSFYKEQKYIIKDRNTPLTTTELAKYYMELCQEYQILYLEDPFSTEDWEGWSSLLTNLSAQSLIVGDNLTATNPYRLQTALDKKTITGIVVKPIQVGTVIESLAVVEVARAAGLKIVTSARSEETNDDFMADFSVAVSSDYIKFGSTVRGEFVAKYNRLLDIEGQLKNL